MGEPNQTSEGRDGSKISGFVKCGIVVDEIIIEIAEQTFAIGQLPLERIVLGSIENGGEIYAPTKCALITRDRSFDTNIT